MTLIVTYRLVVIIRFRFYCRTIHKNYRVSSALFVAIFQGLPEYFYKKRYQGLACLFCDIHSLNEFTTSMDELGITVTYC